MDFLFAFLLSTVAHADITLDQAHDIACHAAAQERPPLFLNICESAQFDAPQFTTDDFFSYAGYDENRECSIQVRVYRRNGRVVVHSDCD